MPTKKKKKGVKKVKAVNRRKPAKKPQGRAPAPMRRRRVEELNTVSLRAPDGLGVTPDLDPCPCCRGQAVFGSKHIQDRMMFKVVCCFNSPCSVQTGYYVSEEVAAIVWNNRVGPPKPKAQAEEARQPLVIGHPPEAVAVEKILTALGVEDQDLRLNSRRLFEQWVREAAEAKGPVSLELGYRLFRDAFVKDASFKGCLNEVFSALGVAHVDD